MIRIIVAISLIALMLACAQKDAGKGLNKLSGRKTIHESDMTYRDKNKWLDSAFYIGYVDYFPETKEFYTALFYREGHEYPDEDLLESKLDSVIVFGDDWGRERLPLNEARKMLVLSGLDSISIYNPRHELVCQARLKRVEYLWDGLESNFIAVFEGNETAFEQTEELYGITANLSSYTNPEFAQEEVNDVRLNAFMMERTQLSRAVEWDMRHYRLTPSQTTMSILSSYSMSADRAVSYLTSLENNEVQILNAEVDNFHFLHILPVPIMVNGKPLLLISAGYPSSDVIWDYLAWYDGAKYDPVNYNRIQAKDLRSDPVFFVSSSDM